VNDRGARNPSPDSRMGGSGGPAVALFVVVFAVIAGFVSYYNVLYDCTWYVLIAVECTYRGSGAFLQFCLTLVLIAATGLALSGPLFALRDRRFYITLLAVAILAVGGLIVLSVS